MNGCEGENLKIRCQIRRSLRKSCSITVEKDGTVTLKMPLLSTDKEAEELLYRHRRWIMNRILELQKRTAGAAEPGNGQNKTGAGGTGTETAGNGETAGKLSQEERNRIKREAMEKIPERVAYYAPLIGVDYGKISYRFQKSRWGSCTKDGNLSFNCLLMLAPPEVLDSVIVHELCHRKFMNHSDAFYREIAKVFPDYSRQHLWLKKNGEELMGRVY